MEADEHKLECAFVLADRPDTHRKAEVDGALTKEEAFGPLSCTMWATFGAYASQQGYEPFGGVDCSDVVLSLTSLTNAFHPLWTLNSPRGKYKQMKDIDFWSRVTCREQSQSVKMAEDKPKFRLSKWICGAGEFHF